MYIEQLDYMFVHLTLIQYEQLYYLNLNLTLRHCTLYLTYVGLNYFNCFELNYVT